jgi:hypothetical protein
MSRRLPAARRSERWLLRTGRPIWRDADRWIRGRRSGTALSVPGDADRHHPRVGIIEYREIAASICKPPVRLRVLGEDQHCVAVRQPFARDPMAARRAARATAFIPPSSAEIVALRAVLIVPKHRSRSGASGSRAPSTGDDRQPVGQARLLRPPQQHLRRFASE